MGSGGASDAEAAGKVKLVGFANFVRLNPRSDKFTVHKFHHVEFWTADATNTYKRFQHGLGMTLVAKSDQSTNNSLFASYVLQSGELVFTFTAPYSRKQASATEGTPFKHYKVDQAYDFVNSHGMGVRAVGLLVDDAKAAYETAVTNGATGILPAITLQDADGEMCVSEVGLYGDVMLRFVSSQGYQGPYVPGYERVSGVPAISYGIRRLDHAVGNVHKLLEAVGHIMGFTGFHEFAEFVAEDIGTVDSGLNSMVLANNTETVLLPINEPTFGTPRKSQIQTYLEQNEGPGLQHLALLTDDIFRTLREMRARSDYGGFEFMPRASDTYYRNLPAKIGDILTPEQYKDVEGLGILVDKDDQGVLLQIFTKPLSDRPTIFIEIIQRVGCMREVIKPTASSETTTTAAPETTTATSSTSSEITEAIPTAVAADAADATKAEGSVVEYEQAAGCGGFGKGNFSELFKSIEDYERTLNV